VFDPNEDGVTHINCWSKGRTKLGQALSNFAHVLFKHPQYGHFASTEAFWYFLKSGCKHNHLKRLYGTSAKSAGIKLEVVHCENFKELICEALRMKILQNKNLRQALKASTLPLAHYFVYGSGTNAKVHDPKEHQWQMDCLENIRRELQGEGNDVIV
jgi:hypothetical protein